MLLIMAYLPKTGHASFPIAYNLCSLGEFRQIVD